MKNSGLLISIIILIVVVCCGGYLFISILTPSHTNQVSTSDQVTSKPITIIPEAPAKPQEGDVISGMGRKEIEDQYKTQKALSDVKASIYAESIVNKQVVWVGTITNITDTTAKDGYIVILKMGKYWFSVADFEKKYGDLNVGQLVKVSGAIGAFKEDNQIGNVLLKDTTITVLN